MTMMLVITSELVSDGRRRQRSPSVRSVPATPARRDMSASSLRGSRQQLRQANQVERRAREDEAPVHVREAAQLDFADPGDGLQPPKRGFDARPRVLAHL